MEGYSNYSKTGVFHVGKGQRDQDISDCPPFPSLPEGLEYGDAVVLGDELIRCSAPEGNCLKYDKAGNSWINDPRNSGNRGRHSRPIGVMVSNQEWWVTGE